MCDYVVQQHIHRSNSAAYSNRYVCVTMLYSSIYIGSIVLPTVHHRYVCVTMLYSSIYIGAIVLPTVHHRYVCVTKTFVICSYIYCVAIQA